MYLRTSYVYVLGSNLSHEDKFFENSNSTNKIKCSKSLFVFQFHKLKNFLKLNVFFSLNCGLIGMMY